MKLKKLDKKVGQYIDYGDVGIDCCGHSFDGYVIDYRRRRFKVELGAEKIRRLVVFLIRILGDIGGAEYKVYFRATNEDEWRALK